MASKVTKKTTTTTFTQQASSGRETTPVSSPGRSPRPSSPTMISRLQEKHTLAHLNDRLAAYIDRVRFLETENSRLQVQVRTSEETVSREVTNLKTLYEKELSDARRLLDETSKDKAKLQIEVGAYKTEAEEWKEKFLKKEKDFANIQKKVLSAEQQVADLQAKLTDAVNHRKHWENEYNKIKPELDALLKQLETSKKQLESETLMRVDFQNRMQSLEEEMNFKSTVHAQELNETRTRTEFSMEETDGKLQQEYESRLQDALREMREQNEEQIRLTREETETVFESKMVELRKMAKKNEGSSNAAREEMWVYKKRVDELVSENSKMKGLIPNLEARIIELETQITKEREEYRKDIDRRDAEIRHQRETLESQMQEYQDLLDVKIALDLEIAAYRKLLESEETRLNISTSSEATPSRSTPRRTPMRSTPVKSGKRKRMAMEVSGSTLLQASAKASYSATSSAKGSVEVYETDSEGKFVKLFNSSDKDVSLGGWSVKHTGGEQETTYKFHRSAKLAAGQYATVWSSDSEKTHAPPTDYVMKGQRWFTADVMKTQLLNPQAEEMANRDMTRIILKTSSYGSGGSGSREAVEYDEGELQDKKECIVM